MLIVISVIAILVGLIVPSIAAYRSAAKKAKTTALISALCTGLDAYRSDHRKYPDLPGNLDYYHSLNMELYRTLSGDLNLNLQRDIGDKKSYLTFPSDSLDTGGKILDGFGNAIGYWPYPEYHNRTSYNLWSMGADGATGEGHELGDDGKDDINNWR